MFRPSVIAFIGLAVALVALVLGLSLDRDEPANLPPPPAIGALPAPPAHDDGEVPAIQIVRVAENGNAMIAGKAPAGATLAVLDDQRPLGQVTADDRGEWVFVPELPFAAGARELSIRATLPGGAVAGGAPVVLVRPPPGQGAALAFQTRLGRIGPVLQGPPVGTGAVTVGIVAAELDQDGRLFISGRSTPEATVHVYLDNRFIGRARADRLGDWRLAARAPSAGKHVLRSDQVEASGRVLARIEQPWEDGSDMMRSGVTFESHPEEHVWRVLRPIYGGATLYMMAYQPDPIQLGDPNLIYPGQVFTASGR